MFLVDVVNLDLFCELTFILADLLTLMCIVSHVFLFFVFKYVSSVLFSAIAAVRNLEKQGGDDSTWVALCPTSALTDTHPLGRERTHTAKTSCAAEE